MNKCVHLFGGVGISQSHYKHAIEVYKSNNFRVCFYKNNHSFENSLYYNKKVNDALKNDGYGNIVHTHSGGFWAGVSYQSQVTQNKLFICESSPFENNPNKFIEIFEEMYQQKCPIFLKNNNANKYSKPSFKKMNPDWTSQLQTNITNIPNFVNIISKTNNIVDWVYIDFIMNSIQNNNNRTKQYVFHSDKWSKRDIYQYQDILQNHIDQIKF